MIEKITIILASMMLTCGFGVVLTEVNTMRDILMCVILIASGMSLSYLLNTLLDGSNRRWGN